MNTGLHLHVKTILLVKLEELKTNKLICLIALNATIKYNEYCTVSPYIELSFQQDERSVSIIYVLR